MLSYRFISVCVAAEELQGAKTLQGTLFTSPLTGITAGRQQGAPSCVQPTTSPVHTDFRKSVPAKAMRVKVDFASIYIMGYGPSINGVPAKPTSSKTSGRRRRRGARTRVTSRCPKEKSSSFDSSSSHISRPPAPTTPRGYGLTFKHRDKLREL